MKTSPKLSSWNLTPVFVTAVLIFIDILWWVDIVDVAGCAVNFTTFLMSGPLIMTIIITTLVGRMGIQW